MNYQIFIKFDYYQKFTFGRFFEIIPFCISGYIMAFFNINHFLKKSRIKAIYLFSIILIFLIKYNNMTSNVNGFGYQGIKVHIKSICFFIIFTLFTSEKIKNKNIINLIKLISNVTPGIYYLHYPLYIYLKNYILLIKNQNLCGSLIIYIICFLASLIGNKIFYNNILKHLFQ